MRTVSRTFVVASLIFSVGCMSWMPGWELSIAPRPGNESTAVLAEAEALFAQADTRAAVERAIAAFEWAAAADPSSVVALGRTGEAWCLLGACYAERVGEKRAAFRRAVQYCERAMATNRDFDERVRRGESVGEASAALGAREIPAMHFWVTALSYMFKETLSPLLYPFNLRWIERERMLLERMSAVEPEWGGGAVDFSWAIYYLALPASVGGDMERSKVLLDTLVANEPDRLLPRWGRAKYYFTKVRDKGACREDLEWVAAQDPRKVAGEYAWNAYFHTDARRMLADLDRIFAKARPR